MSIKKGGYMPSKPPKNSIPPSKRDKSQPVLMRRSVLGLLLPMNNPVNDLQATELVKTADVLYNWINTGKLPEVKPGSSECVIVPSGATIMTVPAENTEPK